MNSTRNSWFRSTAAVTACLVTGLVISLGGCATTSSKVRVDKADADLTKCQTFDWLESSSQPASFTDQRVKAATLAALRDKGYTQATDKPDCKITYALTTSTRAKPKPGVGVGVGGGSGGLGGGIGITLPVGKRGEGAGTFTIDIVDVARNAQIWSGSVDAQFAGAEPSEEEAAAIVKKILGEFPDRA
jgi:hypothetical protein